MQSESSSTDITALRYESLLQLGRVLTGVIAPEDVFAALADRASRLLSAEAVLISSVQPDSDQATILFSSAPGPAASYPGQSCMAIRERRPVLHSAGDPPAACVAAGLDCRQRPALCAPILREGTVAGTLTALATPGSVYGAADLEYIAALADLLGRAPNVTSRQTDTDRQYNALADRVLSAVAALQTDEALQQATRAAHELAAADGAALWLVRAGGELEVAHSVGRAPRRGERLAPSPAVFRILAEAAQSLRIDADVASGTTPLAGLARVHPTLIAPLVADGRVLGALSAGFDGREPPAAAARDLPRVASLAAVAAAHARLHEQIGALALIDPLTGIPNRRHLGLYLEKEFAAARRGRRLTVLLFELDDFDAFVRDRGQAAADAVLRAFGEVLVQQTRAMNLAARFDDNAFVVALADADRRAGFIHASRVARAVEAHALLGPSAVHPSVGIATFSPRLKSFDDLLRGARTDLAARRAGQGRLTL